MERDEVTEALAQEEQTTREALAAAVAAYRRVVLDANPYAPPDLVAGETVAEIDASLERARAVVAQVREQIAAATAREVPAGVSGRTAVDLAGLSAREKIAYGLGR